MARVALCPVDGDPLVATLAFAGAEFVCLTCGGVYGWLEPRGADETPELLERMEANKAEWVEHAAKKLIGGGIRLKGCPLCDRGEVHMRHATAQEIAEHGRAMAWIAERTKKAQHAP